MYTLCNVSRIFLAQLWNGDAHLAVPVAEHLPVSALQMLSVGVRLVTWMVYNLPRHVQLYREKIHLVALICLADLSVGQRSVQSMFALFSVIHRFLLCPSSVTSFICDFLTAEPWQMSTGESCYCGLKGRCPELSPCFSVAGYCLCNRVSRRTERLRCWIWSPASDLKSPWSLLCVEVLGDECM